MLKILANNANFISIKNIGKKMENNHPYTLFMSFLCWITGFAYSIVSGITQQKLSSGLDLVIKALTIISICYVIYWHRIQIKKSKNEKNFKG